MEQIKSTPGQWKVYNFDKVRSGNKLIAIVYPCTETGDSTPEGTANARLIAAAPDMLAALLRILDHGYICEFIEDDRNDHALLCAAIAKAIGYDPR